MRARGRAQGKLQGTAHHQPTRTRNGERTATGAARKDVAHIWELGGGFKMKELVKVPLTMERVPKFVFCIVVDLSRPGDALEFLLKWMKIAKDRVAECMRKMKQEASKVADGVMLRAKRRLGSARRGW